MWTMQLVIFYLYLMLHAYTRKIRCDGESWKLCKIFGKLKQPLCIYIPNNILSVQKYTKSKHSKFIFDYKRIDDPST